MISGGANGTLFVTPVPSENSAGGLKGLAGTKPHLLSSCPCATSSISLIGGPLLTP